MTAHRDELEDAIRRFLAFAPEHVDLADQIAREAATLAAEVVSGRVGRTRSLSLEERASRAVTMDVYGHPFPSDAAQPKSLQGIQRRPREDSNLRHPV